MNTSTLKIDRQKVYDTFAAYVKNYNDNDPKVKLKIEHTYRVAALCDRIGRAEGLTGNDLDLCWLTGMLHDVGRFEQVRRFGTFNDAKSIDHAICGLGVLFDEGHIRDYVDEGEDALIDTAIRYHNVYRIPENLSEREYLYVNILRDADKIDILKVNCDFAPEDIYDVSSERLRNEQISEAVMEAVGEHHTILKAIRTTAVDNLIGHISLSFELVYDESVRILKAQGYLDRLLNFQSNNSVTMEQFAKIRCIVNEYLDNRLQQMN